MLTKLYLFLVIRKNNKDKNKINSIKVIKNINNFIRKFPYIKLRII